MIYDVRQITTCAYASPVAHARHVLRLTPVSRDGERVHVASLQIVQSKICDMAVGVRTARLLVQECAEALQSGGRNRALTSMAKMYASDVAFRSAADAVQIHGAAGISAESRVGRFLRDSKVLQIVEGSNDLHRALIGEMVLGLRRG